MYTKKNKTAKEQLRYAPGIRVEIRDAEWRVKAVDYASDGGYLLTCEGSGSAFD